jgi:hypothetical protein
MNVSVKIAMSCGIKNRTCQVTEDITMTTRAVYIGSPRVSQIHSYAQARSTERETGIGAV